MAWLSRGWSAPAWYSPGWWGGRGVSPNLETQFAGFDVIYAGVLRHLCLVPEDAVSDVMGGVLKMRLDGVNYGVYLVDTDDDYASNVHVVTTAGVKAIRLKTPITYE